MKSYEKQYEQKNKTKTLNYKKTKNEFKIVNTHKTPFSAASCSN
jgi:hypothetical protein